jgi:hypothetical protein
MAKVSATSKDGILIGQIGVDSGCVELGDCGKVQLSVPTKLGDGLYPVYLSEDGCKITIDTTPFQPSNEEAWRKQLRMVSDVKGRLTMIEKMHALRM